MKWFIIVKEWRASVTLQRGTDFPCPALLLRALALVALSVLTFAPTAQAQFNNTPIVSTSQGGIVSATYGYFNKISATSFSGDGSGLIGISIQGDRIISGSTTALAISSTGYISLTTGATTWGYLSSAANYLPNLIATTLSSTNISGSLIQVGTGNSATCDSSRKGALRYSSTSNTLEYCNSTAWTSAGPSATSVSFAAHNSADQTITTTTWSTLSLNTEDFDTNNNFASSKFTPTVPGMYLITGQVYCASAITCAVGIFKNGVNQPASNAYITGGSAPVIPVTSYILDMNGSTDYVQLGAYSSSATINSTFTSMRGILIAPSSATTGGGSASAAGNSTNLQYNSSGAFAGSDNLTWNNASGLLSVTGKIGIGTTTPSSSLNIYGGASGAQTPHANYDDIIVENGSGTSSGMTIKMAANVAAGYAISDPSYSIAGGYFYVGNQGGGSQLFYGNGAERMRIDGSGNVGIAATPNSSFKLDTLGLGRFYNSGVDAGVYLGGASGGSGVGVVQGINAANNSAKPLILQSSGGNVGIFTATPNAQLDVNGTISSSYYITTGASGAYIAYDRNGNGSSSAFYRNANYSYLYDNSAGNVLIYDTSGRVGIDMVPGYMLDVSNSMRIYNASNNNPYLSFSNSSRDWRIYNNGGISNAFNIYDATGATHRMVITTAGKFGFNTTGPGSYFDVVGPLTGVSQANAGGAIMNVIDGISRNALTVYGNVDGSAPNATGSVVKIGSYNGTGRSISAAGTVNASGGDYAEYFLQQTPGELQKGQLACLTPSGTVAACAPGAPLVGIVSTKPGFVGNDIFEPAHPNNNALIGLMGQVPTRLTLEGGEIHVGDRIAVASRPGYGKKATASGPTIGFALADYTSATAAATVTSTLVFIQPETMIAEASYKAIEVKNAGFAARIQAELRTLKADNDNLRADFEAYKRAHP